MRKARATLLLAVCIALLTSVNACAERKFPYCGSVQATMREMNYAIARLANGDPTFDLAAFEEEVVRLESFDRIALPWRIAQCLWLVSANVVRPDLYDLRSFADRLSRYTYGDWREMARVMHTAAYAQISLMSAVEFLDNLLAKQLSG